MATFDIPQMEGYKTRLNDIRGGMTNEAMKLIVQNAADDLRKRGVFDMGAQVAGQIVVQVMNEGLAQGLSKAATEARQAAIQDMSGRDIWFQVGEGDTANDVLKASGKPANFNIGTRGILGTFFEALFFHKAGNSDILPDILDRVEAKAYDINLHQINVGTYGVKISESDVKNIRTETIRGDVKRSGTPIISEAIERAIGMIKLMEKMFALLLARTQREAKQTGNWIRFRFLSVMVYSMLDVDTIMAAYRLDKSTDAFFTTSVKQDIQETAQERNAQGWCSMGWRAAITTEINIDSAGGGKLKLEELYKEHLDLLTQVSGGREAFYNVMLDIEKENKYFDVDAARYLHADKNKWRTTRK
jgi:hypothetical protein